MSSDKAKKEFAKQYKKSIHERTEQINVPFIITTTSCPSSGFQQKWYLPPEISFIGEKENSAEKDEKSVVFGGTSQTQYIFVAKKVGIFCILGENRRQWLIKREAMFPDRYIIHAVKKT